MQGKILPFEGQLCFGCCFSLLFYSSGFPSARSRSEFEGLIRKIIINI